MADEKKAASKPNKPQMITQVTATLEGVRGEFNVNGIVESIVEQYGLINVLVFEKEQAPKYWAIVHGHDVTPLV